MTTPYRGYTEIPGSSTPDVPYRTNLALREIDADVHDEAEKTAALETRVKGLEKLGNLAPGDTTDASMTAVALAPDSQFSKTEAAKVAAALAKDKIDPLALWKNAVQDQATAAALWVSVGSSTAAGGNVTREPRRWFNRLAALLGPRAVVDLAGAVPATGVQVFNGALGGTTSEDYLTTAKRAQILAINPQLVTHMVGSNDYAAGRTPEAYKANMRARVTEIRNGTRAVQVLIHQQPRYDITAPAYPWRAYGQALRELAGEFPDRVVFLDIGAKFEAMGIALPYSGLVHADKMHLMDEGNKILAELVGKYLGLPPVYTGKTVIRGTPGVSGAVAQGAVYSTIKIPARPYLQRVTVHAMVFSGADAGAPDWLITSEANRAALEDPAQTDIAVRVGARQAYSGNYSTVILPHVEGNIQLRGSTNGGALYMTGTAAYNDVFAVVDPA